MTNNEEAFKQAEKELKEERVKEIKELMKDILQSMQKEKEKKEEAEERIRILKMELEDLREGRIDKIKERHDKSKKVEQVSPIRIGYLQQIAQGSLPSPYYGSTVNAIGSLTTTATTGLAQNLAINAAFNWADATAGVYTVQCSNGTTKQFYF